jgi:hypothetical protein
MDWLKKHAKKIKKVATAVAIGAALYNAEKIGKLPRQAVDAYRGGTVGARPRDHRQFTDEDIHRALSGGARRRPKPKVVRVVKFKRKVVRRKKV